MRAAGLARLAGLGLAAVVGLVGAGCGNPPSVDLVIRGANRIGATQLIVTGMTSGSVRGMAPHSAVVPDTARPLADLEDLRITLAEADAGQVISIHVSAMKGSLVVGTADATGTVSATLLTGISVCLAPPCQTPDAGP